MVCVTGMRKTLPSERLVTLRRRGASGKRVSGQRGIFFLVRTILAAQELCESLRLDNVTRANLRVVRLVGEPEWQDTLFLEKGQYAVDRPGAFPLTFRFVSCIRANDRATTSAHP